MRNFNTRAFRWARLYAPVAFMLLAVTGPPGCTTGHYSTASEDLPGGGHKSERRVSFTRISGEQAGKILDGALDFVNANPVAIGGLTIGGYAIGRVLTAIAASRSRKREDAAYDEGHRVGLQTPTATVAIAPQIGGAA